MSKKENTKPQEQADTEEKAEETAAPEAEEKSASAAEKELEETKDKLLRLTAEYSNFKRRSEKERLDAYNFAKSDAVKELLPAIDNLERALANQGTDFDALKKGVEMTYNTLIGALSKIGVEVYGEAGETFDPALHNAVMHIEDDALSEGEIVDVFQKGYKIGDRIIRPAMVKSAN